MAGKARVAGTKRAAMRGGELTQADYERLAEFRYLLRRFLVFSEEAAEQAGLTAQQHQALLVIKGRPGSKPMPTGMLAERLAIRHHSAVGLIDRLIAKNLIRRRNDSADRRQVLIDLTPKAEKVLQSLTVAHREEIERLAPLLRELLAHF
jgi:DNA-binding MarR family transcriptional regulator